MERVLFFKNLLKIKMHVKKSIKLSKKIRKKETILLSKPNFNKVAEI